MKARIDKINYILDSLKNSIFLDELLTSGVWNVYCGPLKLERLNERHMRIEDKYGRPRCKNV